MTNDGLEALVALGVSGLPKLDRAVGRSADQHLEAVDIRMDQLSNLALVSLG